MISDGRRYIEPEQADELRALRFSGKLPITYSTLNIEQAQFPTQTQGEDRLAAYVVSV